MVIVVDAIQTASVSDKKRASRLLAVIVASDTSLAEALPHTVDEHGTEMLEVFDRRRLLRNVERVPEELPHAERLGETDEIGTDSEHLRIDTRDDPHLADGGGVSADSHPSVVFETDDTGH